MFENAFNNIDRAMRNDEGLASELDYAEQTSWLLFLKYLDDMEHEWADEAVLRGDDQNVGLYHGRLRAGERREHWVSRGLRREGHRRPAVL